MNALAAGLFVLSCFLSVLASPAPGPQAAHPPWDQVYIEGMTYHGTGCPVVTILPGDDSIISVGLDPKVLQPPAGSQSSAISKSCQLSFNLHLPAGWSLTIVDMTIRADILLDTSVTLTQHSVCHWSGQPGTWSLNFTSEDGTRHPALILPGEEPIWSSCKGTPGRSTLATNNQFKADYSKNTKGSGYGTPIGGNFTYQYLTQWKKC